MNTKIKKPLYKRAWVWIAAMIVLFGIIGASNTKKPETSNPHQPTTTESPKQKEPSTEWDVQAVYDNIQNGMTKTQVEETTKKPSVSCTESEIESFGKSELCTYGNVFTDKAAITVTFHDGKVVSKSKSTY